MSKTKAQVYEFFAGDIDVDFKPSTEAEEILQNVKTICATPKGSRPMDRDFGINPFLTDKPMMAELARVAEEITQCLTKYEPRAKLTDINLHWHPVKKLWPEVKIQILNTNA